MTTIRFSLRAVRAAVLLACVAPFAAGAATPTVLDFEDLSAADLLPAAYGGLDWSAGGWAGFDGDFAPYTPHSGGWRVATGYTLGDDAGLVRFSEAVNFGGAWFSGYADGALHFDLFYQGSRVGSSSVLTPGETPSFLASGYAGLVDAVRVTSSGHGFFAMDDFTYTAAPVPEPASVALMLAGLAAVGAVARRRRAA